MTSELHEAKATGHSTNHKPSNTPFLPEVESLRGLAALAVVVEHSFLYKNTPQVDWFDKFPGLTTVWHWLIHVIFNGRAAVVLFFVISGFVLARQLDGLFNGIATRLGSYFIRRFFRIVPAMWIAILFAYAVALFFHRDMKLDFAFLLRSLLLQDITLNTPLWSLEVEIVCCAVFPLLYALNVKGGKIIGALLALSLAPLLLLPLTWPLVNTLRFIVFFQVGILVGTHGAAAVDSIKESWRMPLFCAAWLVLSISSQLWPFFDRYFNFFDDRAYLLIDIPIAFFILSYIVHGKNALLQSLLRARLSRHLGKISFSLYILHYALSSNLWPVYGQSRYFNFLWSYQTLFSFMFFLIIAGISIPLANFVYKHIEVPFSDLGRRIGQRILIPARNKIAEAF